MARTRDRLTRLLQFSVSGKPSIEEAYCTHWVSPRLSEAKRRRLAEAASRTTDAGGDQRDAGLALHEVLRHRRRPADHGGSGPGPHEVRPNGSPGLPAQRRCRPDQTGPQGQHALGGRGPLEPGPQAL